MINKKCMCKFTHRTGMKVSLAYWEVSRHSWRSHLADGFDGRLQIPESGNRGTYLSIAPCCNQPPDRPYWVTCCTLKALKRSPPTGLSPQVAECVTSVITEGLWSSQGCKEEKGFVASSDWSTKDITSTFWWKRISPEPSPAWGRLSQACPRN